MKKLLSVLLIVFVLTTTYTQYNVKALYEPFPGYNISYNPTWYDANVTTIQKNLNLYWGIYAGTPDGYFGDKTLNAVKIFQSENGLTIDGVVGRQTWYAICNP